LSPFESSEQATLRPESTNIKDNNLRI
jgi:hypothetical protein